MTHSVTARPPADPVTSSVERRMAARIAHATRAASLRARMRGTALAPGDEGWAAARAAFDGTDDRQPALIALPRDAADVLAVIGFARDHGMRIVPHPAGHDAPAGGHGHRARLGAGAMTAASGSSA